MGLLPDLQPEPGEVVIDVHACGVNYFDSLIIENLHHTIPPRPFAPGGEAAGIIACVGEGVHEFVPGDRVSVGSLNAGCMAEQLCVPASFCNHVPAGMSWQEAAAYPVTYGTAYYGLKNLAHLQTGETLLVMGAAGGVGLATVEIGRAMGARVVAAASSQEKLDIALRSGAHSGVVYPRGPFDQAGAKSLAALLKSACAPGGADVICDPVGGDYSEAAVRALRPYGRSLIIGFPAGIPKLPLNLALLKACQIIGCFWGPWVWRNPQDSRTNMDELAAMFSRGEIRPWVSQTFSFNQGGEAIACLAGRQALGKLVVNVRNSTIG
jgi:NADPH2:quinone reductase